MTLFTPLRLTARPSVRPPPPPPRPAALLARSMRPRPIDILLMHVVTVAPMLLILRVHPEASKSPSSQRLPWDLGLQELPGVGACSTNRSFNFYAMI
jgi:hypothetical protein